MRRLILLALIGTFLIRDVTSKVHYYPLNLAWLFGSSRLNDNREETRTVCDSEECKKMANTMLGNMNKSVDPCNNFYEYACGRWVEHNPIPDGYVQWTAFAVLQKNINQQVKDIVEAEPAKDDLRSVKLAKKWYKACMDTDAIEREGLEPLVSTLSRLGGWPMTMGEGKWNEREYNWQKVDDQYMRLTGRNSFHDVRIQKFSSDPVVEIDTPHLPPGSKKLRSALESVSKEEDEEEDEENEGKSASDEDPSDEEKQSEEEPGSEGEDDSKIDDRYKDYNYDVYYDYDDDYGDDGDDDDDDDGSGDNDDDDDGSGDNDDDDGSGDNDDDDGSGDNDDDDGSGDDDDNDGSGDNDDDDDGLKEVGKKKITIKITIECRKNQKLRHVGHRKSGTRITKKHGSHTAKRQRIRRWAIGTEVNKKRTQRFNRREKLRTLKSRRNHVRKVRGGRMKKILDSIENTTTVPRVSTEETSDDKLTPLRQYADYISKVARVIAKEQGTDIPQQRLQSDIQDMIDFQLKLIKIIPDSSSILSTIFDLEATLHDFQDWYDRKNPKTANGKIDWVNKIKALFNEANEPVDGNLSLEVISPSYIEALASLLDETPNQTIVNYIHWNFISKTIKTTTKEMRELYEWWEKISDNKKPRGRSDICKDSAEMKDILAYEFVKRYFSEDFVKTTSDMLSDVQKEVEYLIKESDWLDNKARKFALAKVQNLNKIIGYPNWYKNATIIEEYLTGLVIGTSYYENALRYGRYTKWKSLRTLSENRNVDFTPPWTPTEVNAFFLPWKNTLTVTAADFQSPFFAYGRPQAINYGALGLIIAHEVNHGFDNTGHMFDKDGTFLGWFSAMAGAYDEKKNCFIEQFNNYPIDEKANKKIEDYGEQTTGDNIADTMGLQAIFKAYQREERESNTSDAALPGMEDVTNEQLFFLSFANLWCEATNSNMIMKIAKGDVHSIGRLRVIGSVSNSDDFAKAYNCPVGSPMNPEKKCNIWK